mmetsp:Transcript_98824/g.316819  ORF Transcript_98824/g.316819 Transcript_98824/m.316819 type:complete len:201 (+) Transcript_98824:2194-2796(+)
MPSSPFPAISHLWIASPSSFSVSTPRPSVLRSRESKGKPRNALARLVFPTRSKPAKIQRAHQQRARPCSRRCRRKERIDDGPCATISAGGTRSAAQPWRPKRFSALQNPRPAGNSSSAALPPSCSCSNNIQLPVQSGSVSSSLSFSHSARKSDSLQREAGTACRRLPESQTLSKSVQRPSSPGKQVRRFLARLRALSDLS